MDRFIQPSFGRPPFQTAVDDPYETYEANILWDQEESEADDSGGRGRQDGLLADSAAESQMQTSNEYEGKLSCLRLMYLQNRFDLPLNLVHLQAPSILSSVFSLSVQHSLRSTKLCHLEIAR